MPETPIHTIRLVGPWERSIPGSDHFEAVKIPLIEIPAEGMIYHYRRRFGTPRTLDVGERVDIVADGVIDFQSVTLNQNPLSVILDGDALRVTITERLQSRNVLEFVSRAIIGEVRLEFFAAVS